MLSRDFFVFCTSLRPIELRAVGALSRVLHVAAGESIYQVGDAADAFFAVNRGSVELTVGRAPATVLSRGDIFGDLELLTNRTRLARAQAREAVSLQCFDLANLDELGRQVPSFYRFLCEKLAQRLVVAHEQAAAPEDTLELSGNLANFDLVTIYQTIMQSAQTGELTIVSESGDVVASFHFSGGDPFAGRFRHLVGEEAFLELFLADDLRGTFSFASGPEEWNPSRPRTITLPANDMLFTAIQFRDEFQALKAEMPATMVYESRREDLLPGLASVCDASAEALEQVWSYYARQSGPIVDLFPLCSVCELKIYQAVRELARTGHLALSAEVECHVA